MQGMLRSMKEALGTSSNMRQPLLERSGAHSSPLRSMNCRGPLCKAQSHKLCESISQ